MAVKPIPSHSFPPGAAIAPLRAGRFVLDLDRPLVMGVVNVTPDSFFDGGRHADPGAAIAHARRLVEEGADILDVGGESSRPGAPGVEADEECRRVLPVVDALAAGSVPISVDTCKPEVMRRAIAAGAAMINDIEAARRPGALEVLADSSVAVCLMHMQGTPRTMQTAPAYGDVVRDVRDFLRERIRACSDEGIAADRIVVDPGFGFGKTVGHNLELLGRLGEFAELGVPVLAGLSRKSMLLALTGREKADRLAGSLALALLAAINGAQLIRVHDVGETKDALRVLDAVRRAGSGT